MSRMPDDGGDADDRSALAPDELDIENDENVVSLDEGRYVIGTDERPTVPESAEEADDEGTERGDSSARESPTPSPPAPADSGAVKQRLEEDLEGSSARYGFHVSAKSEDAVSHQQMFSDDVGTVFDSLLRWYAQQLTTEMPAEDVLGILLTESNVRVRYSPSCLQAILEAYDLGPDDTIADLYEAVRDDRGMVFPPENV
ncbi:DUF7500 family protein [Halorussus amylolyticus]|uniref:DUF7500 family protein n=1 Tax=Halorussus amylolyticus TaxID=1126242 RepID=UPI001044A97B|nr:hypothetical protein [Halorussus amylolyticus]